MNIFLQDIQEAEANVTKLRNEFLRERGWEITHSIHKSYATWNNTEHDAELLTTDEAISVELFFSRGRS